jgi:glycosyltransferase involved in cell wall biosynthesis
MQGQRIFVILPAYNEATAIADALTALVAANLEAVVVDDGSVDDTWSVLAAARVHALKHVVNLGQGAALETGVRYALRAGADVVVHMDADGQHRVEDIPALVKPILENEADVVLGSRFLREDDRHEIPPVRRLVLRAGRLINGLLTGLWLSDAHNGFRALSRRAATVISLRENGYAHASEILISIRQNKLRCVERPTRITYSGYSRHKGQSLWNSVVIVSDLLMRRLFK